MELRKIIKMSSRLVSVLVTFLVSTRANCANSPEPYEAGQPVIYPPDFCEQYTNKEEFDFVVIGSGPGGSSVARRLAEVPENRVLLLEAGIDPDPISDIPQNAGFLPPGNQWLFGTKPSKNECRGFVGNSCLITPGKVLGGSSVTNFLMYVRGNHKDFDEWEALGNPGWSYKDVLPYFKKLENFKQYPVEEELSLDPPTVSSEYHAVGGPLTSAQYHIDPLTHRARLAIIKAAEDKGLKFNLDVNGEHQIGITNLPGIVDTLGYRSNAAKAYLRDIPDNLKVCKKSLVTKLIIHDKSAVGADFKYNGTSGVKSFRAKATKEYIVAGGPINSPALLERSGIGRKDVLKKAKVKLIHELPGVGENLQDHYSNLGCAFQIDYGTQTAENPLTTELTSLTAFFNTSDPSSSVSDMQFLLKTYNNNIGLGLGFKPQIKAQFDSAKGRVLLFASVMLRQGKPGSTHISQATDPTKSPIIIQNEFTTALDTERTVKAVRLAREIFENEALKPFKVAPFIINECKQLPYNSEKEIMCGARYMGSTVYHHVGTNAMGPKTNPKAVVDPELRVHGIKNLRVVDSSIMPLVTRGNTNIPTIMIGEKAADMIKSAYGQL